MRLRRGADVATQGSSRCASGGPQDETSRQISVAAVVVAWNTGRRIAEWIEAVYRQTRAPDEVIMVDNGSDDETVAFVRATFPRVTVIENRENLGHAGGAQRGIAAAYERGHDWFWMFDDDAYPEPDALERCLAVAEAVRSQLPGFIYASSGEAAGWMWKGRKVPVSQKARTRRAPGHPYQVSVVDLNMTLVARAVMDEVGEPRGDFFMMMWEPEYCLRARRAGFTVWVVPDILVRHEHAGFRSQSVWRSYYQTRNHVALALSRRSARELWWCAVRQARFVLVTIIAQDRKLVRLSMRLRGAIDGLLGRMGRRVDPSTYR